VASRGWTRCSRLALPDLLQGRAAVRSAPMTIANSFGRARSCILCFLFGAPAHQDIWDLKPTLPPTSAENSGPSAVVCPASCSASISRSQPIAPIALPWFDSVHHPDNTHTVAMHYMLTGPRHAQPATQTRGISQRTFPVSGRQCSTCGPDVRDCGRHQSQLPRPTKYRRATTSSPAFCGPSRSALRPSIRRPGSISSGIDPLPVPDFAEPARLTDRHGLLESVDIGRRQLDAAVSRQGVWRLPRTSVQSGYVARSTASVRPVAGTDHRSRAIRSQPFRSRMPSGRRLVEAGVGFGDGELARDDAYWDTHANNFRDLKEKTVAAVRCGFSGLTGRPAGRRPLDETLVMCLGEFGRTPRINKDAGRDTGRRATRLSWPAAESRGGHVLGSSDRIAAYQRRGPFLRTTWQPRYTTPWDRTREPRFATRSVGR